MEDYRAQTDAFEDVAGYAMDFGRPGGRQPGRARLADVCVGELLRHARAPTRRRPADRARRRSRPERRSRPGAEPPVLAAAIQRGSERGGQGRSPQRSPVHDRGRRPGGLPRRLRVHRHGRLHAAGHDGERLVRGGLLVGQGRQQRLHARPAEARRLAGAGPRRRRGGRAPAGGPVSGNEQDHEAGRLLGDPCPSGSGLGAGIAPRRVRLRGTRGPRPAGGVRQRRRPAAGARHGSREGTHAATRARRRAAAARAATGHRDAPALGPRRGGRPPAGRLDQPDALGHQAAERPAGPPRLRVRLARVRVRGGGRYWRPGSSRAWFPRSEGSATRPSDALRDAGRAPGGGGGRHRLRDLLVVAQVAVLARRPRGSGPVRPQPDERPPPGARIQAGRRHELLHEPGGSRLRRDEDDRVLPGSRRPRARAAGRRVSKPRTLDAARLLQHVAARSRRRARRSARDEPGLVCATTTWWTRPTGGRWASRCCAADG